jgi:hypothetical protein
MRSDEWRDLVCDRGRDRIPGHKPRHALTPLAKDRYHDQEAHVSNGKG